MQETVTLEPIRANAITLPIEHNHMIQGMIYGHLDEEVANFIHEEGFQKEKRTYRMFVFSRLMGNFRLDRKKGQITFIGPVKLIISSPYSDFSNSIGNSLLSSETVRLGSNYLRVKDLIVERGIVKEDKIEIETMSPIVAYSTLFRKDGRKFTYYFNPKESEFSELISNNLKNKYKAFTMEEPPKENVEIKPITNTSLSIVKYKGFIIKGYMGRFFMEGPIPLLQMGIGAGFGSKNSQGFGCVKLI